MDIRIEIINKALKNETMESPDNDTLKELARVFHENSMLPYLYKVFRIEGLKSTYFKASLLSQSNDVCAAEITKAFNEAGIKHFYFKGQALKSLYEDKALRLMGDIDLYVDPNRFEDAIAMMQQLGYSKKESEDHHVELEKKNHMVELHRRMVPLNSKWYEFFANPLDNAKLVDGSLYKLDDTFHLLFILTHYVKHVIGNGAGIRPFIDMYLMLLKLNISQDKLNSGLEVLGLQTAWNTVLNVINYVFGYSLLSFEQIDFTNEFIGYTFNCGIHGFGENNTRVLADFEGKKRSKIGYLFSRWFISYSRMKQIYPFTRFILLLPLGYIVRFFDLLLHHRKKLNTIVKADTDSSKRLIEMMEKAGIVE